MKKLVVPLLCLGAMAVYIAFMRGGADQRVIRKYVDGYTVSHMQMGVTADGFRVLTGNVSAPAGQNIGAIQLTFILYGRNGNVVGEILTPAFKDVSTPQTPFSLPLTDRCEGFALSGAFKPRPGS